MVRPTTDYNKVIRSTPDPQAPSAPSPTVGFLSDLLGKLILPPVVLIYAPFLFVLRLFQGSSGPKWSLLRFIGVNALRLNSVLLTPWMPRPRSDEEQWGLPVEGKPLRDAINKGELEFEVVKLEPIPSDLRKGIADVKGVEVTTTPGFWVRPTGVRRDKVILYIHGGAYIRGHPFWTAFAMGLAKETGVQVFATNYRKCLSDSTAFPAPLLDVLSAYTYLLKTYDASAITFSGDSAGAHLCLFLSRYLLDIDLPQPGSMALVSPWSDFVPRYPSYTSNGWWDFLHPKRLEKAIRSTTRWYTEPFKSSVWFSPAKAAAGDWNYLKDAGVQVHLTLGTRELFVDEIRVLYDTMLRDDVDVDLHEHVDGVHAEMVQDSKARAGLVHALKASLQGDSTK